MATSTGRDQGIPGTEGTPIAAHKEDKGLAGAGPPDVKSLVQEAQAAGKSGGGGSTPSAEMQSKYLGDVDKAAPNQPITAAKQAMEEERGQTFTSSTGKPTQPSPTIM